MPKFKINPSQTLFCIIYSRFLCGEFSCINSCITPRAFLIRSIQKPLQPSHQTKSRKYHIPVDVSSCSFRGDQSCDHSRRIRERASLVAHCPPGKQGDVRPQRRIGRLIFTADRSLSHIKPHPIRDAAAAGMKWIPATFNPSFHYARWSADCLVFV
jgi:hypothetical protein